MKLVFDAEAWEEYLAWQREDARVLEKLNGLIEECRRDPFKGTGKPEPLRQNLTGWWSRRITGACRRHQNQIATAVKRAREIALLPYVGDTRESRDERGGRRDDRDRDRER